MKSTAAPTATGSARGSPTLCSNGMASDLAHLRPKALARDLDVSPRAAIEACLAGVKAGLLSMKWDLLCTNCRGAKVSVGALSELPRGAHCASCNIDYDRDFERNVELSFAPAPTIRPMSRWPFLPVGPDGDRSTSPCRCC